jgi:hypothetical protein
MAFASIHFSRSYASAIRTCLIWQIVGGVLISLFLDMGQSARAGAVALLSHWAIILFILCRRPLNPTRLDLAIISGAFLPLWLLIMAFGPAFLRATGVSESMIPW